MQDVAEEVAVDAESFGCFIDRQSLAHDQTHCRPIDRCFVSIAFMRMHGVPQRASRTVIVAALEEKT